MGPPRALLEPGAPTRLAATFLYQFTLAEQVRSAHWQLCRHPWNTFHGGEPGAQDWFTNVQLSHPELVHVLPCQYNRQTSIQWLRPPYEVRYHASYRVGHCTMV